MHKKRTRVLDKKGRALYFCTIIQNCRFCVFFTNFIKGYFLESLPTYRRSNEYRYYIHLYSLVEGSFQNTRARFAKLFGEPQGDRGRGSAKYLGRRAHKPVTAPGPTRAVNPSGDEERAWTERMTKNRSIRPL